MVKNNYLAMKTTGSTTSTELISSDLQDLGNAAKKFASHAIMLTSGLGLGSVLLQWIASIAAIQFYGYFLRITLMLFVGFGSNKLEDQHSYRTFNPIHFLQSSFISVQLAQWRDWKMDCFHRCGIASLLPQTFSCTWDWLEMPGALILLIVVAPSLIADTLRDSFIGAIICLAIACYLLQEHIRASGGFRNSFTKSSGVSNSVGIIILLVYPVWALFDDFL
ncbi:unnamed protein product [Camellia sinensis]